MKFEEELRSLINRYSKENASGTPDFILAKYMCNVLDNFSDAVKEREAWYGRALQSGNVVIEFTKEEAVILAENLKRSLKNGEVISADVDSIRSIISCACDGREWER